MDCSRSAWNPQAARRMRRRPARSWPRATSSACEQSSAAPVRAAPLARSRRGSRQRQQLLQACGVGDGVSCGGVVEDAPRHVLRTCCIAQRRGERAQPLVVVTVVIHARRTVPAPVAPSDPRLPAAQPPESARDRPRRARCRSASRWHRRAVRTSWRAAVRTPPAPRSVAAASRRKRWPCARRTPGSAATAPARRPGAGQARRSRPRIATWRRLRRAVAHRG